MDFEQSAAASRQRLEDHGLRFQRVRLDALELVCDVPVGWQETQFRDGSTLLAHHGSPPVGTLAVGRATGDRTGDVRELLHQFVAERLGPLSGDGTGFAISEDEAVEGAVEAVFQGVRDGVASVGRVVHRPRDPAGAIVAYQVTADLYHPDLVKDLVRAVLLSVTPAGAERPDHAPGLEIPLSLFWRPPAEQAEQPFGQVDARFALKLPPGWRPLEVSDQGISGWLLLPPGSTPSSDADILVSISADDLVGDLRTTLVDAVSILVDDRVYARSCPPLEVEVGGRPGLVQVYHGTPPNAAHPETHCLWSLGVTDGVTVAHLFAIAPVSKLEPLLPALNAIGRTLRVLPRTPNRRLEQALCGYWRYLDSHEEYEEVGERCFHLRPDGTFSVVLRTRNRLDAIHHPPRADDIDWPGRSGHWDVVGTTLTMVREDGTREMADIDGVSNRTAIVDRVFWERIEAPTGLE